MINTSVSYLSTAQRQAAATPKGTLSPSNPQLTYVLFAIALTLTGLCIRTACLVLYLCIQVFRHQMYVSSTPSGTSPPNTASNISQSHSLTSHHGKVPFRENVVDASLQASNVWYEFESTIYFVRVAILTIFVRTLHYTTGVYKNSEVHN